MESLKLRIMQAEWQGYRWALEHPHADADAVEAACYSLYPETSAGVLLYAFERGCALARAGQQPEEPEPV